MDEQYMREMLRQRARGRVRAGPPSEDDQPITAVFPKKKRRKKAKKPVKKPAKKAARGPRRKTCLSKPQLVRLLAMVQSITPAQMTKLRQKAKARLERHPPGRGSSFNKSVYVAEVIDRCNLGMF